MPWFLGSLALGCFSLWLGLAGLLPTLHAMDARAPVVSFQPRDTIPLPLAVPFFAFAANCLIVGATLRADGQPALPRSRRDGINWIVVLVGIGMAGAALALFAPPVSQSLVAGALAARGYRRCPAPFALAHPPPMRWARAGAVGRCPIRQPK